MVTLEIAHMPDTPKQEQPTNFEGVSLPVHSEPFVNQPVPVEIVPKPTISEELEAERAVSRQVMVGRVNQSKENRKNFNAARTDTLTQLPNRLALDETLKEIYANSDSHGNKWIVFIDLNDMKAVNDLTEYKHAAGDDYLIATANAIRKVTRFEQPEETEPKKPARSLDQGFRISGDEFVLVMDAVGDTDHFALEDSLRTRLLHQLLAEIQKSTILAGVNHNFYASIGAKLWDGKSQTPGEVLKDADERMYENKKAYKKSMTLWGKTLSKLVKNATKDA